MSRLIVALVREELDLSAVLGSYRSVLGQPPFDSPPQFRVSAMIDDPAPTKPTTTAVEWLAEVRQCEREAELFLAYDLARQGLEQFPDDLALKHRAVLCLASTGARARAAEEFLRLGLAKVVQNLPVNTPASLGFDLANLEARLLKDEAIAATGPDRIEKLKRAGNAYQTNYQRMQAADDPESYYPAINAATLRLLSGNSDGAQVLARQVLDQLAASPIEKKGYYHVATELEAKLILDDFAGAKEAVRKIVQQVRHGFEHDLRALASTIRQLRLVAAAKQIDPDTLAELAPPSVIHYLGHIISAPGGRGRFPATEEETVKQQIAQCFATRDIGFAYGSLAAGADILFAETALEHGVSLNIFLPFAVEEFIEVSVRPAGAGWVERFHRCFDAGITRHFATTDRYLGDDILFGYCSQLAMGLALLRANHTCAPVEQLAVWDGKPAAGPAGTAVDVRRWKRSGMPQTIIPVSGTTAPEVAVFAASKRNERRSRAMLFGDVHGFSKLTDEQLPGFVETVLGAFGRVIDRFRDDVRLVNTWGDGLFIVFDDAGKAAACAIALQEAMNAIDLAGAGLPDTMALRLGGHLGPVYAAQDPILHSPNFFGAHVSRAARIEPVTPEKLVYVTETMAAVLALYNADEFECSYVGMTKGAKDYGEMRMFLISRTTN